MPRTEETTLPWHFRLRALRYAVTFVIPMLAIAAFKWNGMWTWAVPFYAFIITPILELLWQGRVKSLTLAEERAVLKDPVYDLLLYVIVPMQWGLLVLFLLTVSREVLTAMELSGCIATMGILCGIYGINVAHELGHRTKRWERAMARGLLLSSLYMHFIIEHNQGHHRRVATPDDPASARYGETVYGFWFRSIVFSWLSAWRIEAERLRKARKGPFDRRNEMIHAMTWQAGLLVSIVLLFGWPELAAFSVAALIGVLMLETVNYIEHYGLRRKRTGTGVYGRVQHIHSWNSDHFMGRSMLFELTRHSDHHWKASKKYQGLQSTDDAPQLPTGYPGMMILSLVPPLFFRVVHPRLELLAAKHEELELAA
ncbi:MAG: alkane 1-monooxygenase [Flavobacteriales bacterium]|nr:alkane 1-monooxygenase [Flavobacteriales bacterium]